VSIVIVLTCLLEPHARRAARKLAAERYLLEAGVPQVVEHSAVEWAYLEE